MRRTLSYSLLATVLVGACGGGVENTVDAGAADAGPATEWTLVLDFNSGNEAGYDVATDRDGNIFAAGTRSDPVLRTVGWLRKYGQDGALLGEVDMAASGGIYGVAVDASDGPTVVGQLADSEFATDPNYFFARKYSQDLQTVWTYTEPEGGCGGVAVDTADNTFLACLAVIREVPAGHIVARLIKLDAGGAVVWSSDYAGLENEAKGGDVMLDPIGNIVLVGTQRGVGNDCFVRKHSPTGVPLWTEAFDCQGGGRGAVDLDGNLIVATSRFVDLGGFVDRRAVLVAYSPGGLQLWIRDFLTESYSYATDVAVGLDGSLATAGSVGFLGACDVWVQLLQGPNELVWQDRYDGSGGQDYAAAVAIDATGHVVAIGSTAQPDPRGSDVWIRRYAP